MNFSRSLKFLHDYFEILVLKRDLCHVHSMTNLIIEINVCLNIRFLNIVCCECDLHQTFHVYYFTPGYYTIKMAPVFKSDQMSIEEAVEKIIANERLTEAVQKTVKEAASKEFANLIDKLNTQESKIMDL